MVSRSTRMPRLKLSLLGAFRLLHGERPIPIRAPRMQALLGYLALHPEAPPSRRRLAFLFWPESSEQQARTNLRKLLHRMRVIFPAVEGYLDLDHLLRWREGVSLDIDVQMFRAETERARRAEEKQDRKAEETALARAVELYRGDLMPECYDVWVEPEREALRRGGIRALARLVQLLERRGDYHTAVMHARRLLILDEFDEEGYRQLMRLHALCGERTKVAQVYLRCLQVLQEGLGLEPDPATTALRDRLLQSNENQETKFASEPEIPLVGRGDDLAVIVDAWENVVSGGIHVLTINGEAGVGKTRLAEEVLTYVQRQGYVTVGASCYKAEGRLAYGPVIEWLLAPPVYEALLSLPAVWQTEVLRLLPDLQTRLPGLSPPSPLTESWQRQRLFSAVTRAVLAVPQPMILYVDNIQWCDSDTLDWLYYLQRFHPSAKILILATLRKEALHANATLLSFLLALRHRKDITELDLAPLDQAQTVSLAQYVAGRPLGDEAAEVLYRRTEGNPLFIVEMVRASAQAPLGGGDIRVAGMYETLPRRVQAVIQERLSRLSGPARSLLTLAAVIGRKFTYETLSHACGETDETLLVSLEELLKQRLIRERAPMVYDFSHGIIRDVVWADIVSARRVALHRRIAQALEEAHAGALAPYNARLAYHWEEAGFHARAVAYHLAAGLAAQRLYANRKAEQHLQLGLHICEVHFDGEERDRQMLSLLQALSPSLVQRRGYGAPQVQAAGEQVRRLSRRLGQGLSSPQLRMLAISKLVAGQIGQAEELGRQLLTQAQREDDTVARVEAHYVLSVSYHWGGRFLKAKEHLEEAITLYESKNHLTHISDYAQDPSVICRIRLAVVLWHLAHPLRSQESAREALAIARELDHPFSRSYALHWFAWLQNLRGDVDATLHAAGRSISFSEEYQFPYFATQSKVLLGWALCRKGFVQDGLQTMREGVSLFRATGSEVGCAYYRALIAEALARQGAIRQGLALLEEVQEGQTSGEGWSDASVALIEGRILRSDRPAAAERAWQRAIVTARTQDNRINALDAARELVGLLREQGRREEAVEIENRVVAWATAGLPLVEMEAVERLWKEQGTVQERGKCENKSGD